MDGEVHSWTEDALLNHGQFVRRLARSLVRDEDEAEDLAQEAWLVALRKQPEVREGLRPWLASVLRGLAFTRRRAELRRVAREEQRSGESRVAPAADRALEDLELQQRVVAAVLSLGEPYRTAILLRYHHGLPVSEIARETSSPLETVRTRLRRAQEMLRGRLDGEYGSRRSWCIALAGLGELPEWTPVGIGSNALTLVGGMIMSWKGVAAVAAIVVVGIALWGMRDGGDLGTSPERSAVVHPNLLLPGGGEEEAHEAPALAEGEPSDETDREAVASTETVADAPGIWLVGELHGRREAEGEQARVSIGTREIESGAWRWNGRSLVSLEPFLRTELVIGEPFEIDLLRVFDRGKHVSELHVDVRHGDHLPLDHRLVIDPRLVTVAEAGLRAEVQTELKLRPVVGRVAGTVTLPFGEENLRLRAALVGFDPEGRPNRWAYDVATCDSGGEFELRTPTPGRQILVAWEQQHQTLPSKRPVTSILEIESGDHLHLPPLNLTLGESIEGVVAAVPGETRAHSVKAALVEAERVSYAFGVGWASSMEWVGEKFELRQVSVRTDEQGAFSLTGLGPELYAVSSEPVGRAPRSDDAGPLICRLRTGDSSNLSSATRVNAPARDLRLGIEVAYAGFQVFADGRPAEGAVCKVAEVLPQRSGFWDRPLDSEGRIVFSFRPLDVQGWVVFSAPGWASHRAVHLNENALGFETLQPIHLERIEDPVHLTIHLELWAEGEVGWASIRLRPWPVGDPHPDLPGRPLGAWLLDRFKISPAKDGAFHLPEVTPGRYWCILNPQQTEETGALPWRATSFEVVVPPGRDCVVTHRQGPGGHLRVLGLDNTDQGGLLVVLYDPRAESYCAILRSADGGAWQTKSGVESGDYVLRVEDGEDRRVLREVPVTLTDGEVTEVEVDLAPR